MEDRNNRTMVETIVFYFLVAIALVLLCAYVFSQAFSHNSQTFPTSDFRSGNRSCEQSLCVELLPGGWLRYTNRDGTNPRVYLPRAR